MRGKERRNCMLRKTKWLLAFIFIYQAKERTSSLSVYTQKPTVQARVCYQHGYYKQEGMGSWESGTRELECIRTRIQGELLKPRITYFSQ